MIWVIVIVVLVLVVMGVVLWVNREEKDVDGSPKRLMNHRNKSVRDLLDDQK